MTTQPLCPDMTEAFETSPVTAPLSSGFEEQPSRYEKPASTGRRFAYKSDRIDGLIVGSTTQDEEHEQDINNNYEHDMNELEETEKQRIVKLLPTISLPGVKWTTCIFKPSECVLIRYFHKDGTANAGEEEIRLKLQSSLQLRSSCTIRLEQLKRKPVFKQTSLKPGDTVVSQQDSKHRCIGAYVSVGGDERHAVTAGHGLQEGQTIASPSDEPLGTVKAIRCVADSRYGTCDIAVVKLNDDVDIERHVLVGGNVERYLSDVIRRPRDNDVVQKFCSDPDFVTGKVIHSSYYRIGDDSSASFIAIGKENGDESFHREGESGTLVTTVPAADVVNEAHQTVKAIGMMTATEDADIVDGNTEEKLSLAVNLGQCFHQLAVHHPYCNGDEPRLMGL